MQRGSGPKPWAQRLDSSFLGRSFPYTNNRGRDYVGRAPVAISHLFNHQTHHRAQVHVMLSQTPVAPPSLDLHRIINPEGSELL